MSKDQQVTAAIRAAEAEGEAINVAAIARMAGVGRSYIYGRPGLLAQIRAHAPQDSDERVLAAIREAEEHGEVITVEGIARKAGVGKQHIYRRPQLLAMVQREREAGMADRDKRLIPVTVKFSPHVMALIRQVQGGDVPEAQFIWDAVVETLAGRLGVDVDDVDPVRRQARRRGNYSKRKQQREDA